jgi:uncharacterized integral membrane protein
MGNLKTGLWIVIVGFVGLLFFQNQGVFLATRKLRMDLLFAKYQSPELPDILLFICTFVIGCLISYFASLSSRFKFKKRIKQLHSTLDAQQKELTGLKSEIDGLKAAPVEQNKETEIPIEPPPFTEETPMELEDTSESPQEQKDEDKENKTDA